MFAGDNGMNSPRRALLDFDVACGRCRQGFARIITGVQLTLVLEGVAGTDSTPRTIGLHTVLADWGQGTTGAGMGGGGTGQGFPANPGDATWSQNHFGSFRLRRTPAAISRLLPAPPLAVVSQSLNSAYTWGSTAALVSDVQNWLDSPVSNFGWLLMGVETGSQTFRQFYTQEEPNSLLRPELLIDFTPASVPEPSTLVMAGIATLVGAGCQWRQVKSAAAD